MPKDRNNYKAYQQRKRKAKQRKYQRTRQRTDDIALKEKDRKRALYMRSFKVKAHPILRKLRKGEYHMAENPIAEVEMRELKLYMQEFYEEEINEGSNRRVTRFQRVFRQGQGRKSRRILDILEPLRLSLGLDGLLNLSSCSLLRSIPTTTTTGQKAHRDEVDLYCLRKHK